MKAAIFDVDGTLLDSMSVWEDIGERYLASQNITAEKNLRAALHTMSLEPVSYTHLVNCSDCIGRTSECGELYCSWWTYL